MPPPSPLTIATTSITRLLKEETSYKRELSAQEKRLKALEEKGGARDGEDEVEAGNRAWEVGQEKRAIEETKAVFGPLREKIAAAVERVEGMLSSGASDDDVKEVEAAREAVGRAGRL